MFVLEKWINDRPFGRDAKGTSELDAVESLVKEKGIAAAKSQFEESWKSWLTEDDWKYLQDVGVTSVRAPIGYWMVDNGKFCHDTPFEKYKEVYSNAWVLFKSLVIEKAAEHKIAVLVDLHALPGGANGQDHSGTCSGEADLWGSSKNEHLAYDVLVFLAKDIAPYDNVCALQILNEAPYGTEDGHPAKIQQNFYLGAIKRIREVNPEIPLVVSDAWDLGTWINWINEKEDHLGGQQLGVMLDTHVYKCFSDEDKSKCPCDLVNDVDQAIQQTDKVDVIVGEFSCVLDGQSWARHQGQPREEVVKDYGNKQSQHFYHRARAGHYFWTYKFLHGSGGEWDFREMTKQGCLPSFKVSHQKPQEFFDGEVNRRFEKANAEHSSYWRNVDSNRDWELWRFQQGFYMGFADAREFDKFEHSEIGRLNAWRRSRQAEHIREKGTSDLVWQFEHGFNQGVDAFLEARRA
ncbi:hypothetical protein TRVA0_001S10418 [Trichomonascus vanleenenianus]|uniref:glycoside hydrolase family 5 protein n=1 Tax=Trichomonascus vanleenenianus TaxID=2268995 RepID=UPI003ECAA47E